MHVLSEQVLADEGSPREELPNSCYSSNNVVHWVFVVCIRNAVVPLNYTFLQGLGGVRASTFTVAQENVGDIPAVTRLLV